MHSLSGFDDNQIPEPIMGIEQSKAMKFKSAVMLLLIAICYEFDFFWERIGDLNCDGGGCGCGLERFLSFGTCFCERVKNVGNSISTPLWM